MAQSSLSAKKIDLLSNKLIILNQSTTDNGACIIILQIAQVYDYLQRALKRIYIIYYNLYL